MVPSMLFSKMKLEILLTSSGSNHSFLDANPIILDVMICTISLDPKLCSLGITTDSGAVNKTNAISPSIAILNKSTFKHFTPYLLTLGTQLRPSSKFTTVKQKSLSVLPVLSD